MAGTYSGCGLTQARYQKSLAEHNATLSDLQRELSKLRETHELSKTRLHDMELDNDALENAERCVECGSG